MEKCPPKARPQLYMEDALWHAFRLACLARRVSASQVMSALVSTQLQQWDDATKQEEPYGHD